MLTELMPLAGPVGAVLGASVTYWFTRSKLVVTVGHTSISASEWASHTQVPSNAQLKQEVMSSPHRLPTLPGISVPERVYVTYLKNLEQSVEDEEASDRTALTTADQLRNYAAVEDFGKLEDTYKFSQAALWGWAANEARRGRNFFSSVWDPSDKEAEMLSTRHFEGKDEDGENVTGYLINLLGPVDIGFRWHVTRSAQQNAAVQTLASRLVVAFINHKKVDLMEYFQGVRAAIDEDVEALKRLKELIRQEVEKFSRIQVDLLVSNPGRSGVSLDYKALIALSLKNYQVAQGDKGSAKIAGDLSIEMIAVSEERAEEARALARDRAWTAARARDAVPIVLQPGSTMRIIAYSEDLLSQYAHGKTLTRAYLGAERKMQVTLSCFRQPAFFQRKNDDTVRSVRSRKVLFRDLSSRSTANEAANTLA